MKRVTRLHPRPGTLAERAAATRRVVDRFLARPFCWQRANGWKLLAAQARAMGHAFPPVPRFRSALGARQALAKAGFASVAELLDSRFQRLPAPAFALVGDIVLLPDGAGGEVVCIADGLGNLHGWHDADASGLAAVKFAMGDAIAAWRL